jgi:ABC-type antimicrobial peptide transport system permease subunit
MVGGIGIMNIMLVMVMERTHEIGLRKALGAENRDIMTQFLVESVLICVLGGILGIISGFLISIFISQIFGWFAIVSTGSVMLAFVFSVLVGVVFGLWPAWRAAKLLPIVALRYE